MEEKYIFDTEKFFSGRSDDAYKFFGCHREEFDLKEYFVFRVYAPNARGVFLGGDFNLWEYSTLPMTNKGNGIWEIYIESAKIGDRYGYLIFGSDGQELYKNDPYAFLYRPMPDGKSVIANHPKLEKICVPKSDSRSSPINIYEIHLGSWRRKRDGSLYSYSEIAPLLIEYVKDMGYTHVEIMPISEYPYDPSWGYQVTGYFAPTSRYGEPKDLAYFIEKCHRAEIGVILDWVPAHFPKDSSGLIEFDSSYLYEVSDEIMNEHPEWNTRIFDYSKGTVRSFLRSSAFFWLREYGFDGLRVDAVASMLYLDYGRKIYKPNKYGGNYNLYAIDFISELNSDIKEEFPNALIVAEESTAFYGITKTKKDNGLSFTHKWNMGWMNDCLTYYSTQSDERREKHEKLILSLSYAFSENYVLPLSHDEVVHGKGSLIGKSKKQYEDKFRELKLLYSYQFAHPGAKLSFMGNEIGQFNEWSFERELDWFLLNFEKHRELQEFVKKLNYFYLQNGALWDNEKKCDSFRYISVDDKENSVIAFMRIGFKGDCLLCIFNFGEKDLNNYLIGLPNANEYRLVFSSADILLEYSSEQIVKPISNGMHGFSFSANFDIPFLSASFYKKT